MVVRKHNPLKVGLAMLGAGLLLPLIVIYVPAPSQDSAGMIPGGVILGLALVLITISIQIMVSFPRWKQYNRRRRAAVQGHSAFPLIGPQPSLPEASLHLPLRISSIRRTFLFAAYYLLLSGASFLVMTAPRSLPRALASGDWNDLIYPTFFSLFSCAAILLSPFRSQRIVATPEALVVTNGTFEESSIWGKQASIRWDEARLFAVYEAGKFWKAGLKYELASDSTSVEWHDYRQPRWWVLQRADERYTEQMEMLLAYISARTGLPLYDLR